MPDPGSHQYDVKRTRLREEYDDRGGLPDQRADEAANEQLQRDHPPRRPADDRARGPYQQRVSGEPGAKGRGRDAAGGGIDLRSSTFTDHDILPRHCSPDGENTAPVLDWDGVPDGTAELAVVCEDPDAPYGTFLHWMVTGIAPTAEGIGAELPQGAIEARNDFGQPGWGGPQPPVGDPAHRYFFHVFAADEPLSLSAQATADELYEALDEHELAHGTIVGLYQR